jgi:hypothetical protein
MQSVILSSSTTAFGAQILRSRQAVAFIVMGK